MLKLETSLHRRILPVILELPLWKVYVDVCHGVADDDRHPGTCWQTYQPAAFFARLIGLLGLTSCF